MKQVNASGTRLPVKGLMIFFLVVFTAQLKASEAVMIGFGQNSCEEFNSDVRESNQWAHHYFSWAAGILGLSLVGTARALVVQYLPYTYYGYLCCL